ncbi:hypothetical protein Q0M94_12620 [Deinococcus radiomollis]|uniref:hypothetical protein n=1 Tax=Deinococcus radiomollis TaxID=468916 RepID=UPI00389284CC
MPTLPRLHRTRTLLASTLAVAALTSGLAGATSLDFGVSYVPSGGTLAQDGLVRVGVRDFQLAGFSVAAGLGTRGLDAALLRSLVLPGLGVARARAGGALLFSGGLRGDLSVSGTAGPVALTLTGSAWNAGLTAFDPLARWAETAPDLREGGASLEAGARYRLNRDLVLNVVGTLGGQSSLLAQAELRADALSYRFGLRAGQDVLGLSAGATYTDPDSGLNAALDALAGPQTFGLSGHLGLDGALGEGSSVRVFAAYEPWRTTSEVLRYGAQIGLPLGNGTLSLEGYGGSRAQSSPGQSLQGQGFGLKVGYVLSLDAAELPATSDPVPAPTDTGGGEGAPAQP